MDGRRFFLLGATASGKSAVGVALARRLGAEILSADSMLVYRGMDVGTAKPTPAERAGIPHHLLDLVDPWEEFSVARWLAAARAAETDVAARGRVALYVGGTALYLKARSAGLHPVPVPAAIREEVEAALAAGRAGELRAELARVDPELHARIHAGDHKRLARGIEVWRATGRPLSAWQRQWRPGQPLGRPAVALRWPRGELRARIAWRFDAMLAGGLVEEVREIQARGGFGRTAAAAIGYREVLDHLAGACSLEEARERAIRRTRTLVRRQETWLRSFPDLQWLEVVSGTTPEALAATVEGLLLAAADHSTSPTPT